MTTEKKCVIAEHVGEALIGGAIAVGLNKANDHLDSGVEKALLTGGVLVGSWMAGRAFAKQFFKFCDVAFGTEFKNITDAL